MALPSLPPAFQLIRLDGEVAAFERAIRAAPRGIDHGTVYWSEQAGLLDMALVLEPEAPASASLEAVHMLTVAGCEALAQLVPPALPVACAWPAEIVLDGARLGGVRATMAPTIDPTAPPPWLVVGLRLRLDFLGDASDTATAAAMVEAVSRSFLSWSARCLKDGPAPVHAAWNGRCIHLGEPAELSLDGERITGLVAGLDAAGYFIVGDRALALMPPWNSWRDRSKPGPQRVLANPPPSEAAHI